MKAMLLAPLLAVLVMDIASAQPQVAAPQDPAKPSYGRQLLEATGGKKQLGEISTVMFEQFRPMLAERFPRGAAGDKMVDRFLEKLLARFESDEFLDLAGQAYTKQFSDDELKALIAFYETPLGRRYVEKMPQFMRDLQSSIGQWGEKAWPEIMGEMLKEFPELRKAAPRDP